jgi:type VI secretion system secreted protein VgrG
VPHSSLFRYTFEPAAGTPFQVISFTLKEGLSQPFELHVELSCSQANVDFAEVLDQPALFTLWHGEHALRHVHGAISEFTRSDGGFRRTRYYAVVEPDLFRAELSSDWRIYQHLNVPQIIDEVLHTLDLTAYEQRLGQPHQTREYCVQAGETHFDFIARLAAQEGLLYRFEHRADGHRLIYADEVQLFGAIGHKGRDQVLFNDQPGGDPTEPALRRLNFAEQVCTATQVQRDYSFKNPRYAQQHRADGRDLDHQQSHYERFDYPGGYKRDEAGKPFTKTRLAALRNDARVATVEGDDARLQPGLAFDLIGHRREAYNRRWRPIYIEHHGTQYTSQEEESADSEQGTTYQQTAHLVASDLDWKTDLLPRPRLRGVQTATVVGPPGEQIYCDEWGRIKVSFPWDRYSQHNEHSSCWVRVSQGWAGAKWGAIATPRIGQEVIIQYHNQDPDQPFVIGSLFNAANRPPYPLPKHKTRMTLKSQTHKGVGFNELRFEDENQQEEIYIHAQKDRNLHINHDETTVVGHDRSHTVEHDAHLKVGNDRTEQVGQDEQLNVLNDRHQEVGQDDSVQVIGNQFIQVGADMTLTVKNCRRDITQADHWIEVGGNAEHQVEGEYELETGEAIEQTTPSFWLEAGESAVLEGPGGSITLDDTGITVKALKITFKGEVVVSPGGMENPFDLISKPAEALPSDFCVTCFIRSAERAGLGVAP